MIDRRGHASQPRLDPTGIGLGTARIAGPVIVEAKDRQAQSGQAVGQGAVGEVDADRLDAQGRTEDHPTSGHHPSEGAASRKAVVPRDRTRTGSHSHANFRVALPMPLLTRGLEDSIGTPLPIKRCWR